jgi:hypothetical protein
MIRELIDTDLELVAGGTGPVGSFNTSIVTIPTFNTQSLLQNNSLTQTGVSVLGGDVTNFSNGQSNSAAQVIG